MKRQQRNNIKTPFSERSNQPLHQLIHAISGKNGWVILPILMLSMIVLPATRVLAQEGAEVPDGFLGLVNSILGAIVDVMATFLFFQIGGENGFPFIVLWLFVGAIFFTFRLGFIFIRGFKHAIDVVRGVYDDPHDDGEVSHFQALSAALSGTVGLGNIAGVAVAIQLGGPGAMFWLTAAGLFGMTSKFVECTLGVKYRRVLEDGTVLGGPMYYLTQGMAARGLRPLGQGLSVLFAILCLLGSLGGANMFQSNQAYAALAPLIPGLPAWLFGIVLAILAGLVIIGGIRRIGAVAEKLVPGMAVLYAIACLWILLTDFPAIPGAVATIFTEAFTPTAVGGGIVGVMVQGIRRSSFSNEAGIGSAAIAHSAARTDEPIREGMVALLEPFIDTIVICNLTALVIVITGVYTDAGLQGVEMTSAAFGTAAGWFPVVLSLAVCLFAFSTIISWSYYGIQSWTYLFGARSVVVFKVFYLFCTFVGAVASLGVIIDFSDIALLSMAFPNLLGCYFFSNEIAADLQDYWQRLTSGQMLTTEQQMARQ